MASPQYSTPYSQLSYPSYTPLSGLPVKKGGSPAWSGGDPGSESDLRLLRAAVRHDVARQHNVASPSPPFKVQQHQHPQQAVKGSGWPAPDTAGAVHRPLQAASFSSPFNRTNAPLYAPQPHATVGYSDVAWLHARPASVASAVVTSHRPTRPPPAVVVGGTEVDVQSDVVSASEAVPYLCAFQDECQSLLAMLGGPVVPSRVVTATAAAARAGVPPPSSVPAVLPLPPSPVVLQRGTGAQKGQQDGVAAGLRSPPPAPPTAAVDSTASRLSSLSPVATAPQAEHPNDMAAASPPASTTYAQLLQEMDQLASLLHTEERSDSPLSPQIPRQQPQQSPSSPSVESRSSVATTAPSTAVVETVTTNETPEKQTRQRTPRLPSTSRLAPATVELVGHSPTPFWAAQLQRWVVFLIEKKMCVLRRIQAFENTRAPLRRGAQAETAAGATEAPEESPAVRLTSSLLRLLRSLDPTVSDMEAWTVGQQRQMCTRVANLLAELTTAEEGVVAVLLNDAAAGATAEREIPPQPAVSVPPPSRSSAVALPSDYRRDMLETLALLERLSSENAALKAEAVRTQTQLKTLRDAVKGERDAKREVAEHFDRVAAQNGELTTQLRAVEAKLREAEASERPTAQEGVLRDQLDRQTHHLRDVRSELDEAKEECDALRRTVLQLRDALVRHRAVIDLLTRHRRERQNGGAVSSSSRQASARNESPPMQLIEDILSGVRDAPSSHSSMWMSHTHDGADDGRETYEEEEDDGLYGRSDEASSDSFFV